MRPPSSVIAYYPANDHTERFDGQTEAARWLVKHGLSKSETTARANVATAISKPGLFWGALWVSVKDGEAVALESLARKLRVRALSVVNWASLTDEQLSQASAAAGIPDPANRLG